MSASCAIRLSERSVEIFYLPYHSACCGTRKIGGKKLLIDGSISFKNVSPGDLETDFKSWRCQPGVWNTELTSQMSVSLNLFPAPLLSAHIRSFDVKTMGYTRKKLGKLFSLIKILPSQQSLTYTLRHIKTVSWVTDIKFSLYSHCDL